MFRLFLDREDALGSTWALASGYKCFYKCVIFVSIEDSLLSAIWLCLYFLPGVMTSELYLIVKGILVFMLLLLFYFCPLRLSDTGLLLIIYVYLTLLSPAASLAEAVVLNGWGGTKEYVIWDEF